MSDIKIYSAISEECEKTTRLKFLINQLEKTHDETFQHSIHVAMLVATMCKEMRYNPQRTSMLVQSAMLHDIGKLDIPLSVLDKEGALDPIERKVIKNHPKYGYVIARDNGFSRDICKRIMLHHWRTDGSGYPKKNHIIDKELIEDAELLAICDVYSALVQPRKYRNARSKDYALKEIARENFDIKLEIAFKKMLEDSTDDFLIGKRAEF